MTMTRRLFIIRHGQTTWNLAQRLQGAGADSALTEAAQAQVPALARYLDQYRFAAAFTSPANRARETAELTLHHLTHDVPALQVAAGLQELSYGAWEGRTKADLMAEFPTAFAELSARQFTPALAAQGIEAFAAGAQRFIAACRAIASQLEADDNALIFSHGGVSQLGIQALTANPHLLGLKNLSTSILAETAAGFGVDAYNQTAYLPHVDLNEGNVSIA